MALHNDLKEFEDLLDLVIKKYDLYFNGVEKRPPFELQKRVEALSKILRNTVITNTSLRFRLSNDSAKLVSYRELWVKNLRLIEDGKPILSRRVAATTPAPPNTAVRIDVIKDAWTELAHTCTTHHAKAPSYEKFKSSIELKVFELRERYGADPRIHVSFVDGRVKIRFEAPIPI